MDTSTLALGVRAMHTLIQLRYINQLITPLYIQNICLVNCVKYKHMEMFLGHSLETNLSHSSISK